MFYVYLADLVVTVHLAFVAFVLFGQIAILAGAICRWHWVRNFWFRILHLLAIGIVVFETVLSYECPLTTWERELLHAAGLPASDRTFVGRLMNNVLFYDAPPDVFGPIYYTFGAVVLGTFVFAPPRWPRRKPLGQATPNPLPQNPDTIGLATDS